MDVSVLVFAGVLLGGVRSAPTPEVAPPELILQPPLLVPSVSVPVTYVSRHHAQDELGQVNYGFSHPGQAKNEVRDASGNVAGVYTYIDEENKVIRVEYTAGKDGFRVKSNNLPEGVKDTAEVLAAKLQFVEAYNAAAIAAATAADDSTGEATKSEDTDAINIAFPMHVRQSPVKDTPEVIAAKLQFVEAYNAAALAAANAPNDPIEVSADFEGETGSVVNYNPVKDTPEVVAAKLQFVEAYNAAALAAAAAADDPESEDSSKAVIMHASHPVQDTPEVIAAKLRFVEAYNAAAIAAALAPDDDVVHNASHDDSTTAETSEVTAKPLISSEPVTVLGGSDAEVADVTSSPNEDDDASVVTTVFPGKNNDELQEQTQVKKIHVLKPVKVTELPAAENEALVSAVLQDPQTHSYSAGPLVQTSAVESPVILTPTVHLIAPQLSDPVIGVPVTYVSRHHVQDELGKVSYGFSHPGQAKNEVRDASGNVAGVYTYIDDEDQVVRVEYTAGEDGFQVRSNKVPEATKDTPEVLSAKLQFVEAYNAAALAAAAAPDDNDSIANEAADEGASQTSTFVLPNPVKDTPEVIAAKLKFVEEYNAAALAAANAPDDPVDSSAGAGQEQVTYVNPVRDTPEVTAAKLQFVETYNAAALAAAQAPDNAGVTSESNVAVVYTVPVVQDTPEVIAAKLKFVEDYNSAAIASALAPDDDIQEEKSEALTQDPKLANKNSNALLPTLLSESLDLANVENDISVPEALHSTNIASELSLPLLQTPNVIPSTLPLSVVAVPVQYPAIAVPVTLVSRHHAQDELGQVNYGFSHPGQTKNEIRDSSGNVRGVYTYADSDYKVIRVEYTAGEGGFQVKSNNLPLGVRDTPEVLAAKLLFVEAYNSAALAAATASDSDNGLPHEYVDSSAAASPIIIPTPVKHTPEVIAAKLQFVEAYNAAALASANAPDDLAVSSDSSTTLTSPSPVQDTPEVIAAKLKFLEAYNSAAIAAARAEDNSNADDSSKVAIVYATPVVQDTPEVIAAKLQFVEAYNAAALTAALAPDDAVQEDTAQKPGVALEEELQLQEDVEESKDLHIFSISEVLQSFEKPKDTDASIDTNLLEQYTIAYKASPTIKVSNLTPFPAFMRYSSIPAGIGETSSAIYTNPIPSGVYALRVPLGSANRFLPLTYSNRTPSQKSLPYHNYGSSKQMVMYAPTYTHG